MQTEESPVAEWRIMLIGSAPTIDAVRIWAIPPDCEVMDDPEDGWVMRGDLFVGAAGNVDVERQATDQLALLNGLARTRDSNHQPVRSGQVIALRLDGSRSVFRWMSTAATMPMESAGAKPSRPSPEEVYYEKVKEHSSVREALMMFGEFSSWRTLRKHF
jgi:hypothetical protein